MHHETEAILQTLVAAIFFGILAQVLAHRFKLPAILPLLIFGMAAGPFALGLFDPAALGPVLEVIVHLGVAIILFEGGLSLDLGELRQVHGPVRNLLFVGSLVTAVGAAAATHYLLGTSWSTAALFGAIVTVTGPTVIVPLLRHMIAPTKVRTILLSEGLMIDPIGAVLAYLVLQWIGRSAAGPDVDPRSLAMQLVTLTLTGIVIGFVAGSLAGFLARHRHLGPELSNLAVLAILMGSFLAAEHQAPQSGILASVVMGLTLAASHIPDLNPLKIFKSQLTILIISVLFILLSGQLDLNAIYDLGSRGLVVVAALILVIRPLAVMLSIPAGSLDWKQKTVLALTAPRGIVAAAVASLSAIQLHAIGSDSDAATLEGLVYLVILVTCTWATIMAGLLPRWLGYHDEPSRRRAVLVGSHSLSLAVAKLLRANGWTVAIVDSDPRKLVSLREQEITGVRGDARDAATYEDAGVERDSQVLALTPNDALNLLIAELMREEFSVAHPVVSLRQISSEFGGVRRAWVDLLGARELSHRIWIRNLDNGKAELVTVEYGREPQHQRGLKTLLDEHPERYFFICGWEEDQPGFRCTPEDLERYERLSLLVQKGAAEELAEVLRPALEDAAPVAGP